MSLDPALAASIRLVVSDIDGTLVRNDKSLSERTLQAVARARAAGIGFTLVSARPAERPGRAGGAAGARGRGRGL